MSVPATATPSASRMACQRSPGPAWPARRRPARRRARGSRWWNPAARAPTACEAHQATPASGRSQKAIWSGRSRRDAKRFMREMRERGRWRRRMRARPSVRPLRNTLPARSGYDPRPRGLPSRSGAVGAVGVDAALDRVDLGLRAAPGVEQEPVDELGPLGLAAELAGVGASPAVRARRDPASPRSAGRRMTCGETRLAGIRAASRHPSTPAPGSKRRGLAGVRDRAAGGRPGVGRAAAGEDEQGRREGGEGGARR